MADRAAAWPLETETEIDRLRLTLADARADLQRRDAALLKLQHELTVSRQEVAGAREETVQFQGMLRRTQAAAAATAGAYAALESAAASRTADIARLQGVIATLQGEISTLTAGMHAVYASASWRIAAPVRVAGRLARRARGGMGAHRTMRDTSPHQETAQPASALPGPAGQSDGATSPASVLGAPSAGQMEGVLTLDALHRLSRSL